MSTSSSQPSKPTILFEGWLVLAPDGREFSSHLAVDRDRADRSAALVKGTVVPHTFIESTYWKGAEPHYDH